MYKPRGISTIIPLWRDAVTEAASEPQLSIRLLQLTCDSWVILSWSRNYKLMTLPRVVITGMGVVSPNGIGKEAFCLAILAGKSGVKRISRFDPSDLPVHIAGEIPEFDELAWVEARERKHVSRVVPLAIAASSEAIRDAGLDPAAVSMDEKREIGVILATGGAHKSSLKNSTGSGIPETSSRSACSVFRAEPRAQFPAKSVCASAFAATVT